MPFGYKTWRNNNKIEAQPGLDDDSNTTCVKEKFNAIWLEVNSRQKKEATVETNNTLMMMPLCRVNVLYRYEFYII